MTIMEGRWLCKFCGAENLGRNETCQGLGSSGCGAARQPGTRFYLPENSPVVTDAALLSDARSGQDWNCDHCGGANKGAINGHPVTQCVHCGEVRSKTDTVQPTFRFAEGDTPDTADDATRLEKEDVASKKSRGKDLRLASMQPVPARRRSHDDLSSTDAPSPVTPVTTPSISLPSLGILLGIMAVIFISVMGYLTFHTKEVSAPVTRMSWDRSISIEEMRTLTLEDWDPPSDARILTSETKIRRWDSVLSHYETKTRTGTRSVQTGSESYSCGTRDLGNGYFESQTCSRPVYGTETYTESYQDPVYVQVPRYDDWETYEVDRWVEKRNVKSYGVDANPQWPYFLLTTGEREGPRKATYQVTYTNPAKSDEKGVAALDEQQWKKVVGAGKLMIKINYWGQVLGSHAP